MKKKAPKVEYKTLDEVFEIIKGEMTGGKYKSLVAPMNDQNDGKLVVDNDYMVELKEKYSLALDMWSHWYEEYKKELKIKEQAISLIKDGRFVECLQLLEGK